MTDVRQVCQQLLTQWSRGEQFAATLIERACEKHGLQSRDRAFLQTLALGVLRNLSLLDHWIDHLRDKGAIKPAVRWLLRQGFYEAIFMRTADHAGVFQNVKLARRYEKGLVNALLRRASSEKDSLLAQVETLPLPLRFSLPPMLIDRWESRFGHDDTLSLCRRVNEPASVTIRANQLKEESVAMLEAEFGAIACGAHPGFFSCPELPRAAIERGLCYVQDPSTAIACYLLDPQPGESVLDACAAPGGKSGILAERMRNSGQLVCVDNRPGRIEMVQGNLSRLGVTSFTTNVHDWLDDKAPVGLETHSFDRILIDAPCSNTGVLRRRVDVRWRLTSADVFAAMKETQQQIVDRSLPFLKPGGTLVYSTCSIEPEENDEVVEWLVYSRGLTLKEQRLNLPHADGSDGAFCAALIKP